MGHFSIPKVDLFQSTNHSIITIGHKAAQEKLNACFFTTATINALGITSGETVLNQFRTFRDGWLNQQAFGAAAIARYYDIAPRYIDLTDQQTDAAAMYHWLWSDYLASCHNPVTAKRFPNRLPHLSHDAGSVKPTFF